VRRLTAGRSAGRQSAAEYRSSPSLVARGYHEPIGKRRAAAAAAPPRGAPWDESSIDRAEDQCLEGRPIRNNPINRVVPLEEPVEARYLEFVARHLLQGSYLALLELEILGQ
jgi:hypothetical protein